MKLNLKESLGAAVAGSGSALWLIPLAVHGAYLIATSEHLPALLGTPDGNSGISARLFLVAWGGIIAGANGAFVAIRWRLPNLKGRWVRIPNWDYWQSKPERRAYCIDQLRGNCDACLLALNVFFLAIYQVIYQTNASAPVVRLAFPVLAVFFMGGPIFLALVHLGVTFAFLRARVKQDSGTT